MKKKVDVAIIGGGPAGLNAALMLVRARKNVVVFDEGKPRNRVTREAHGFLTRDGISPSEFRRIAKEEVGAYPTISFVEDTAVSVTGTDGSFRIETSQGQVFESKKLLFAVGMKDRPLSINGLSEVYGKSAFVCPYCDGWELRDKPLVVISSGGDAFHFAQLISGWTNRFTICTNGPDELTDEQREELKQHEVPVFNSPIQSIDSEAGMVRQVVLKDGTAILCEGIFFRPELVTGSDLPGALGCEVSESGMVIVDEFGKTNVPGVYSAGDAASRRYQAVSAAALGAFTAAAMNNELNMEAWRRNS